MGVALHFSLQLANHKSQRSDFGAVCKANSDTYRLHYHWLIFLMKKKETTVLERVAFLLRLSIYAHTRIYVHTHIYTYIHAHLYTCTRAYIHLH